MTYFCDTPQDPLILEPEDWSEDEWATILKLFGMKEAERIKISEYKFEAYGLRSHHISEVEWKKAIEYLNMLIVEYASIGFAGTFGLNGVLVPLKKRFEAGERTDTLYSEIMRCE